MSTITATITYRTYIPWGWIAIPFCRVEFIGSDDKLILMNKSSAGVQQPAT